MASTKFLAKVASGVAKPDGLLVVPFGSELGFLHPLPVERLWGVGPVTAHRLRDRDLETVREVAGIGDRAPVAMLGRAAGRHLHALAHNRDPRRVRRRPPRRSMGAQRALGRGPRSWSELDTILVGLVDRLTRRLRAARRACRTVTLRLRFHDFSRATRSRTRSEPTMRTQPILSSARDLLTAARPLIESRGITLLGVALANLTEEHPIQLALPWRADRAHALDATVDDIRDRYGSAAITRAVLLGREPGLTVPLLPD